MKKICLTTTAVFLLVCSIGIQAQTQLNQLESMKQSLGIWQANVGKDTVEVWDGQQYGKAFIINVYHIIKGQKTPVYINNVGFDSRDGKLKGYALWPDGTYTTWIAIYNADKKLAVDIVDNLNPEKVWAKFEMVYTNPEERIWTSYNSEGVKTGELRFVQVK